MLCISVVSVACRDVIVLWIGTEWHRVCAVDRGELTWENLCESTALSIHLLTKYLCCANITVRGQEVRVVVDY